MPESKLRAGLRGTASQVENAGSEIIAEFAANISGKTTTLPKWFLESQKIAYIKRFA